MAENRFDESRLMFAFVHDLRGYLRTVRTRIQLVQASADSQLSDRDQSYLREADSAAADLHGLTAAMVAYCDAGPTDETIPIGILVRGILLEMKPVLNEAGARVTVEGESDVMVPRVLQTVLRELVRNSCRFRREEGETVITVRLATPDAMRLQMSVIDNGLGVDSAMLEKIFIPFQRLQSQSTHPGYGLGLSTCRKIVEAHGGTIVAEAPAGGGLAMHVSIPT